MKSEMDIMRMDERQRLHWLQANRATLIVVGVVWLLMILFELTEGRTPAFLIVMVPIFASLRFGFYYYYARDRDIRWIEPTLFFVLFGLGHWAATAAAWVGEFSTSGLFGLFPEEPAHSIWSGAIRVLEFPLLTLGRRLDPFGNALADVAAILNSALWATTAFLLVRAARGRRSRCGRRHGVSAGEAELGRVT
jgi:hypothetical protein